MTGRVSNDKTRVMTKMQTDYEKSTRLVIEGKKINRGGQIKHGCTHSREECCNGLKILAQKKWW